MFRESLALMLQVHPKTIDRWVRDFELPHVMVDGRRMYHIPDVLEWIKGDTLPRCYGSTPLSERVGWVQEHAG